MSAKTPTYLGPSDLVFCTGTTRGIDIVAKATAAAEAGFDAISIRPAEFDALVAQGESASTVRERFATMGLAVAELDPLMTWLPSAASTTTTMHSVDQVLAMGRHLRPDCVSVLVAIGAELDLAEATDAFGALCDAAAVDGLRMAIEFFAWSPLHSLAETWAIVDGAGRSNGGIIFDVWHHVRRGGTISDLADIDATRVWGVQIADAPEAAEVEDLATECRNYRRWPGDGQIDLTGYVAALRRGGCAAPLSIEVFGDASDAKSARARAQDSYASLLSVPDPAR